jgi:UDP-glucose 4-epimerase
MPSVLITGVAGFIGSHVADHCLSAGYDVVGIDDLSGGLLPNVPQGVDFRCGSVTDERLVARLFQERRYDFVYHLAAYAAEGLSHFIRRFNYTNNVIGSVNLINEAVRGDVECFVFTSSIAVYGAGQTPMAEDRVPLPEDPYGIAKYAVELDLQAAYHQFGLPYVIFRPHNVYGERQNIADRYRNVIGIFMNQIMKGLPLTIFGDGTQTRAFSHVDDVARPIASAATLAAARNRVFNIGADIPYTVNDLAWEVGRAFGVAPELHYLPARNEVLHAFADHTAASAVFGGGVPISLREGIARMAGWAQQHGPSELTTFQGIEIDKNLPTAWSVAT